MAADGRLASAVDRRLHAADARLRSAAARLDSLSPLARARPWLRRVLERGPHDDHPRRGRRESRAIACMSSSSAAN